MCNKETFDLLLSTLDKAKLNLNKDETTIKKISGGLTNTMYLLKCYGNPSYVFRVNGFGTEKLVERDEERLVLEKSGALKICPQVIYIDERVMLQEYCPGRTLGLESIGISKIHRLIAHKLATLHSVSIEEEGEAWFKKTLRAYLLELGDRMMNEMGEDLMRRIEGFNDRLVLCHNDLRLNNVIYDEEMETVTLIDFEYSASNYPEYDIAHYFWQHEGAQSPTDFQTLSIEHRRLFIKEYFHFLRGEIPSDEQIHNFLQKILIFEAANHFLWSVWSRIQHRLGKGDLDFCYKKNSEARLAKYQECLLRV